MQSFDNMNLAMGTMGNNASISSFNTLGGGFGGGGLMGTTGSMIQQENKLEIDNPLTQIKIN